MVDCCVVVFCWWAIGYGFAFGEDHRGFIGETNFFSTKLEGRDFVHFMHQWAFCNICLHLVTCAMAERMTMTAYILYAIFFSSFIYPVVTHWAWSPNGWLREMGYHDIGGCGNLHMVGGIAGLTQSLVLGNRYGRFSKSDNI